MKAISITKCQVCPFVRYNTKILGKVINKPYCSNMNNRRLDYTTEHLAGTIKANIVDYIPEWCPLENA